MENKETNTQLNIGNILSISKNEKGQTRKESKILITGTVFFNGSNQRVELTKIDIKNNVCAFYINVLGKKLYIGAGETTPTLNQIKDIKITLL